ncbi:MAG: hypothetical protein M1368_11755 [Thaumarchaeota archaeon]|nr:hypothetical protein [Nitrososphaerota archaeon]
MLEESRYGALIKVTYCTCEMKVIKEGESLDTGKKSLYEKYYHPASKEVVDDWFSFSTVIVIEPGDEI